MKRETINGLLWSVGLLFAMAGGYLYLKTMSFTFTMHLVPQALAVAERYETTFALIFFAGLILALAGFARFVSDGQI